ncbi:Outer membrane autotransporter barrel domain, partial [Durusdinium trenchii]
LDAGTYTGTITVTSTAPAATIATIPVELTVAPRFGSIQIVATTPAGVQGNTTFTSASGDADLGALSLTTTNGTAASASFRKRFGSYDITQSLPAGWELDSLTCTGDTDGGSTLDAATGRADIDLDPNETIVCTFANSRDDAAVRLATQRAINKYLVRRGDRIVSAQPDIAARLRGRNEMRPGNFAADATRGEIRVAMNGSLSGLVNHARAQRPQMPGEARQQEQRLDVWFAADYSSISDNRAGDSADSEFGIVQLGLDVALDDQTIVGLMVQRHDRHSAGGIAPARIDGAGWMVGPYAARELENGVIVDLLALFGQSENDINPLGFYTDSFETDRYLIRANISGEWTE